ncbi:MAG TPA: PH domain-containing protein [Bryobacteraceae bacterium]|nr:PH domain-containing protein [Bryobacteraceae bacterium]
MEDRVIHPSMKSVYAGYAVAIVIAGAAMWGIRQYATDPPAWLYAAPLVALIWPIKAHIARKTVTLRFHDDHLTLETGLFSRTRRTVDTAKIQDVTVQQSFGQRLAGVGDLILEDSGESGGMAMRNIDRPRAIADEIIASSKRVVR